MDVMIDEASIDFSHEMADGNARPLSSQSNIAEWTGDKDCQTLLTVSGTEFRAEVSDSQSDAFHSAYQQETQTRVLLDNTLTVSAKIEDNLFAGVNFSSAVLTPNGDRINDELTLSYILLKATNPVNIRVVVHNLAGQEIVRIYDQHDLSGPTKLRGTDAMDLGAPSRRDCVIRLGADTDAGETTACKAVVY